MSARYQIGIDPGVNTGISLWDAKEKKIYLVESMPIHKALYHVAAYLESAICNNEILHVTVEDARQRKWFGKQAGTHALQGAGSIKRDCKIWEDFLTDKGIPFTLRAPGKGLTKLSAERFKALTGWQPRTNEHSRDAAMIVFGK